MNCFRHATESAVGLCKACARGLCPECAVETERGLACRGPCEEEVIWLGRIAERNKRVYQNAGTALARGAVYFGGLGVICLVGGYLFYQSILPYFLWPVGVLMLLLASYNLSYRRRVLNA